VWQAHQFGPYTESGLSLPHFTPADLIRLPDACDHGFADACALIRRELNCPAMLDGEIVCVDAEDRPQALRPAEAGGYDVLSRSSTSCGWMAGICTC
jgi:hypothetical protein